MRVYGTFLYITLSFILDRPHCNVSQPRSLSKGMDYERLMTPYTCHRELLGHHMVAVLTAAQQCRDRSFRFNNEGRRCSGETKSYYDYMKVCGRDKHVCKVTCSE